MVMGVMIDINSTIKESKKILMEYWPLGSFIAVNPLWSLRDLHFFEVVSNPCFNGMFSIDYYQSQYQAKKISNNALQQAIELVQKKPLNEDELNQWVDQFFKQKQPAKSSILLRSHTPRQAAGPTGEIKRGKIPRGLPRGFLFAEQLDEYQFQIPVIWIKEHIFVVLRNYFGQRNFLHTDLISFWCEQEGIETGYLKNLSSQTVNESIAVILKELNIPQELVVDYLKAIYLHIYGWSSFMNWRNHHPDNPWVPGEDRCEIILLMWLYYELIMAREKKRAYKNLFSANSMSDCQNHMQTRYIWHAAFELDYINQFESMLNKNVITQDNSYAAQFIFCIDTRSEGFRRHLEAQGNYQTFGFAGFFGAIFKLNDGENISYQAPALVKAVHELAIAKTDKKLLTFINNIKAAVRYAKKQLLSPFVLFEMLGFWFAFFMIFKTIQPRLGVKHKKHNFKIKNTLSEDEQFQAAYNLLISIGLINNFSKWILICAHQSDNINNPFKASLNCGACGGNSGIPNAVVMCQILNRRQIRARLKDSGINIPDSTQFIPACHHTGSDRLEIIEGSVPEALQQAVNSASNNLRHEKTKTLPGSSKLSQREQSWSELIPELGLINNTAMVIGPRGLTLNKDLQRKVFLHSYEPNLDKNGEILTSILSAPAIVAHWISAQYYFSTINPGLFGAGNKAIHNVLPGIGVLEGNLSDLKIGLPLQSTHFQSTPIHEPRRILIVVYAHKKTLEVAIENSPDFKMLLDNSWIYLKHIEAK
jgi:uncharacterized protein YbcC (UPF0753/DUF2309 family)